MGCLGRIHYPLLTLSSLHVCHDEAIGKGSIIDTNDNVIFKEPFQHSTMLAEMVLFFVIIYDKAEVNQDFHVCL